MYETIVGLVVVIVFFIAYTLFLKVWWKKDIERTLAAYEVMPEPQLPAIQQPVFQEQKPELTQQEYARNYYNEVKKKDAEIKGVVEQPEPQPIKQAIKMPEPMPIKTRQIPKQVFKCPKCSKQFKDEKTVKRHYGMAHYADIELS